MNYGIDDEVFIAPPFAKTCAICDREDGRETVLEVGERLHGYERDWICTPGEGCGKEDPR